jgi:hypothetical protein
MNRNCSKIHLKTDQPIAFHLTGDEAALQVDLDPNVTPRAALADRA